MFRINHIKSKAITLNTANLAIYNNTINYLERYWLRVEEWSNVLVYNNHFGEYNQMAIEISKEPKQCLFENNYITKAPSESLNFKSPHCRVREISFHQPCSCDPAYFKMLSYNDIRDESFCTVDITLAHCFNATLYKVLSYEKDICGNAKNIDCMKSSVNAKKDHGFIDLDALFNGNRYRYFYMYIIGACVLLFFLLITLFIFVRRCCRCRCHSKNVEESANRDIMIMESLHRVPMFRQRSPSFSQSDVIIMEQTLKMMRMKYPPEIYDQVYNNTVKLVAGNLTEADKVATIGEIVRNLAECGNAGTDFVAFTDILDNHLGPEVGQGQRENGPIYFEPNAPPLDDDNNSSGDEVGHNTSAGHGGGMMGNGAVGGEHIYAEPNLQQPLLRSEYNVPIDRKLYSSAHVYTEPVSSAKGEESTLFCNKCTILLNCNNKMSNETYSVAILKATKNLDCTCQAKLNDLFSGFIYS